jgi:hypothetical protein
VTGGGRGRRGGGNNPGTGEVRLLHVGVGDGDDHGIEFLLELDSLGSLAGIISGHRRWCHGTQGGGVVTRDTVEGERVSGPYGLREVEAKKTRL